MIATTAVTEVTEVEDKFNSAAALAEKMLSIIDERGWCRGVAENSTGEVCLLGALGVAYIAEPRAGYRLAGEHPAARELTTKLARLAHGDNIRGTYAVELYHFNDAIADGINDVRNALLYVMNTAGNSEADV